MWHTDGQTQLLWQNVLCVRTMFSFQFTSDESFCQFICPDFSPCNCITSASYILITMNSFRSLDLPLGELMSESTGNNQWLYRWTVTQIQQFTKICKSNVMLNMFASYNKACLFSCMKWSNTGCFNYLTIKSHSNNISNFPSF